MATKGTVRVSNAITVPIKFASFKFANLWDVRSTELLARLLDSIIKTRFVNQYDVSCRLTQVDWKSEECPV